MCIDVVCAVCFWFFCIICSRSEHMDTCKSSFAQLTRPLHSLLCVYRVSTLFSSIRSLTTPQHTRHIFATWSADFANFHPPTLWLIFILNLIWSKPVSCVDSLLLTFVRASLWHYFFWPGTVTSWSLLELPSNLTLTTSLTNRQIVFGQTCCFPLHLVSLISSLTSYLKERCESGLNLLR